MTKKNNKKLEVIVDNTEVIVDNTEVIVDNTEVIVDNTDANLKIVLEKFNGKSSKIRYLDSIGYNRSKIRETLNSLFSYKLSYQHVRNVLVTQLKRDMYK